MTTDNDFSGNGTVTFVVCPSCRNAYDGLPSSSEEVNDFWLGARRASEKWGDTLVVLVRSDLTNPCDVCNN